MAIRNSIDFDSLIDYSSIAASTDEILWSDDDTVVADQELVCQKDLAAIRNLLDSEINAEICRGCNMPFDKGKKRRLIDNCGHERCYSCMFTNETCPLCLQNLEDDTYGYKKFGCAGLQGSEITLYGDINTPRDIQRIETEKSCNRQMYQSRNKVKTNGHLTNYMQSRSDKHQGCDPTHPEKLPKTRPSNPRTRTTAESLSVMTQSCPTPPNSRRNFFLSPKALRSPFAQRAARQAAADSTLSASMSASTTSENRHWPSIVLGKIRSLWSAGSNSVSAGLNQLVTDDEDSMVKPQIPPKRTSENDLYMRLGLLLGENANKPKKPASRSSHESYMSLAGYDNSTTLSSNTSPVSTLTGSSEDQQRMINPSSESVGSLMSMSMSGQSNYSSSSPVSRRHSVTTTQSGPVEDLNVFQLKRNCVRRSARTNSPKVVVDHVNHRFGQYSRAPQLTLKPLFFEVPLQESDPLFVGRHIVIKEIEEIIDSSSSGALISGNPGTGKTALILQFVDYSCFGRRKEATYQTIPGSKTPERSLSPQSFYYQIDLVSERIRYLASKVVAYHFCQADNNNTCLVPDFVHSLAAQLCQAPHLSAYRDYLLTEVHLQNNISLKECIVNPDVAFTRGILEPLTILQKCGKIENQNYVILIDALCEAEYHRPDQGDTITSFLAKHMSKFPSWLKVIATVRTQLLDITKELPFKKLSLDIVESNDHLQKDLLDYINFRLCNSPSIQNNVISTNAEKQESRNLCQHKFSQHLLHLSRGSFLFTKLTLDLLERGHLVAKSSSYKVLPVTLAQIYLLHFNLRFPTVRSFDKVTHILSVCLAALYPLTLIEIYYSVNSLLINTFLPWEEFLQRFKLLSGFLVKRLDNTYMFFHPSFREWLIRRDENESTKFLCDLRAGHSGIAFRLSRAQAPLDPEKSLELGHHILKAHVYRNMTFPNTSSRELQAFWVAESSDDVSAAVAHIINIYNPNVKVSRLFLLAGANPNYMTTFLGNAPILCLYAYEGIVPMVSLLLEFGADVELTNNQGSTALSLASAKGHCDVVRQLIAAGANPGHADTAGQCALVHAARNGHLNIVGYLLACDWVVKDSEDIPLSEAAQQALIAAASQGHTEILEYLLDMAEVSIDKVDDLTGETALTIAATNGCHGICSALINRGADVSVQNKKGISPLLLAVKEGHWAITERLIQNHASLSQTDSVERTPLIIAAAEGHVGLIELLLDKGSNIEEQDREGLTALSWACLRGRQQTVQTLLDRGAKLNHNDKTGRSPLDLAAFQGSPTTVQLLLDKGAVIEHVDLSGIRPLDRAIGCKNVQVIQCFLKKGAKLGPTTWAMASGKPDIMLILLNKLLEDGNTLYRKSRLREAAHRYQYALKKIPIDDQGEHNKSFHQLKINLLLNQSRCKRKMNELTESIELANEVLNMKPNSYEAFYARAKAKLDMKLYSDALTDVKESLKFAPPENLDIRKVLIYLHDEINQKLSLPQSKIAKYCDFAISVDALNE